MPKPRLLITRRVPPEALASLKPSFEIEHYDKPTAIPRPLLLKRVKDKDGLLCLLTEKIDPALLAAAPQLRAVSTISVGYDHVDVPALTARRVVLTNTPGVLTETTADFTWALLMAAARRVVEGHDMMRKGRYQGWDLMMLLGTDVYGKTLGIAGMGRIGQAVARRALGFGMKIIYYDTRRLSPPDEAAFKAEFRSFEDLLRESDYITVHAVLDAATRHLFNARAFALMKPSAILVNAARGPIIDERALVAALRSGRIRAAALDVYEHEPKTAPGLRALPNVVLAPHLASASRETRTKMALMAAEGLLDALVRGRRPEHAVNPEAFGGVGV